MPGKDCFGLGSKPPFDKPVPSVMDATGHPQPKEPMAEPPTPQFPFQHTVIDFCDISVNKYLIFADRYTGWVEAALMTDSIYINIGEGIYIY